jgi:hypothetical protein
MLAPGGKPKRQRGPMVEHPGLGPVDITPSARRLTGSLRDLGYDFTTAVADIVDNSIAARAGKIEVEIVFDGPRSYVAIADDGVGMTAGELNEALRFGTRRRYRSGELGRYGLGLKTASISQARRVSVATRRSARNRRIAVRSLDLDHIGSRDRWEVIDPPPGSAINRRSDWLDQGTGTIVLWENLDRVLPEKRPEGGWARRRLEQLAERAAEYLGMVFHRFLEDEAGHRVTIAVNGTKVHPWNPFAPDEEHRLVLPEQHFEVTVGDSHGQVILRRYVLPPRESFSSRSEFERLSGPLKWNRQQGFYIYRSNRLIQSGGWCGIRAADEHTKFARAALDFGTELDEIFRINVPKMRVSVPTQVRTLLERPVHELSRAAEAVYRGETSTQDDGQTGVRATGPPTRERQRASRSVVGTPTPPVAARTIGAAMLSAALETGQYEALARILDQVYLTAPDVACALGWSPEGRTARR